MNNNQAVAQSIKTFYADQGIDISDSDINLLLEGGALSVEINGIQKVLLPKIKGPDYCEDQ